MKRFLLLTCVALVSKLAFAKESESLLNHIRYADGSEIFVVSLAIRNDQSTDASLPAPTILMKSDHLSLVRVGYSAEDEGKFYIRVGRNRFPAEERGIYMIRARPHQRPVLLRTMTPQQFQHFTEAGFFHYSLNRELAFDDDFLTFFGIDPTESETSSPNESTCQNKPEVGNGGNVSGEERSP